MAKWRSPETTRPEFPLSTHSRQVSCSVKGDAALTGPGVGKGARPGMLGVRKEAHVFRYKRGDSYMPSIGLSIQSFYPQQRTALSLTHVPPTAHDTIARGITDCIHEPLRNQKQTKSPPHKNKKPKTKENKTKKNLPAYKGGKKCDTVPLKIFPFSKLCLPFLPPALASSLAARQDFISVR